MNEVYVKTLQKGRDGIGIKKTEINAAGELVITYTNGIENNLGSVISSSGSVSDEVIAEKIEEYLSSNPGVVMTIPVITETRDTQVLDTIKEEGQYVYINSAGARCTLFVTAYSIPGDSDTEYDAIAVTQTLIRPNELETGVIPGIYFRNGYDIGVGFEWESEFKEVAYKEDIPDDLQDGFSPIVTITPISGGNRVTITDALEPHVFDVMNGADGGPGADGFSPFLYTEEIDNGYSLYSTTESEPVKLCDIYHGADGEPGQPGASPLVMVSETDTGHDVYITDINDTHSFSVNDGKDGVSPIVMVSEIEGGHDIYITDANTTHNFVVMDGVSATENLPIFNVKDYGAVGNGTINDTTALNNAFKACNDAGGGIVYFPPGEYIVQSNYVEFFSNTHIIGVPGKTVITYPKTAKDWLPQALLRNNTTASVGGYDCTKNVIIENIIFDNRLSIAKKCTTVGVGHAENITFRNCKWTGCNGTSAGHCHYIELNACKNVKIIDCIFDKAKNTGDGTASGNKEGIYSEMVNIDAAQLDAYGTSDYYKYDNVACDNVEIKGCKFVSYKQSELGTTYRMAPAIGSHSDATHVGLRVHDCLFEGDWNSQGAMRRATIILFGTNKNCSVYNNTFVAATADLSKPPVSVALQCTEKSNFIHDNKLINYDPANIIDGNKSVAIAYNNYCLTTSSGSMVTDSATVNLSGDVLSIS